jgi:predicted secreted protein
MSVSNDEPQASTPQSARQPEVSDEMVEAACAAFEQAQQWLVASARAYPVPRSDAEGAGSGARC